MSSELGDVTFGFFPIVTSFHLWPGWTAVLPLLPIGAVVTADQEECHGYHPAMGTKQLGTHHQPLPLTGVCRMGTLMAPAA